MTIQKIETGKADPSVGTLTKLARTLGIPIRDLFPARGTRARKKKGRR